jgi:hypothetical protein
VVDICLHIVASPFGSESAQLCTWTGWSTKNVLSRAIIQDSLDLDLPSLSSPFKTKDAYQQPRLEMSHHKRSKKSGT